MGYQAAGLERAVAVVALERAAAAVAAAETAEALGEERATAVVRGSVVEGVQPEVVLVEEVLGSGMEGEGRRGVAILAVVEEMGSEAEAEAEGVRKVLVVAMAGDCWRTLDLSPGRHAVHRSRRGPGGLARLLLCFDTGRRSCT